MTASALYTGAVRHRRLGGDQASSFEHSIALAYLDLGELGSLLGGRLVRRGPGLVRMRRRDLFGDAGVPAADAVREVVHERTGRVAVDGPVRVLANPRVLGTCFNPVAFYYVFDDAERLDSVVAEVTNTPWGDKHAYVLRAGEGPIVRGDHAKALHVSPFQDMNHRHHWAATTPGETLSVHIENRRDGEDAPNFDATLKLHRTELTRGALNRLTLRYPAGALRVLGLIYGHALALKLRGAPHFRPPPNPASAPHTTS